MGVGCPGQVLCDVLVAVQGQMVVEAEAEAGAGAGMVQIPMALRQEARANEGQESQESQNVRSRGLAAGSEETSRALHSPVFGNMCLRV